MTMMWCEKYRVHTISHFSFTDNSGASFGRGRGQTRSVKIQQLEDLSGRFCGHLDASEQPGIDSNELFFKPFLLVNISSTGRRQP